MPVMLAVMEIPGCLVALYLVSEAPSPGDGRAGEHAGRSGLRPSEAVAAIPSLGDEHGHTEAALEAETELSLEKMEHPDNGNGNGKKLGIFSRQAASPKCSLIQVLYLLFGGIAIGFISGLRA